MFKFKFKYINHITGSLSKVRVVLLIPPPLKSEL